MAGTTAAQAHGYVGSPDSTLVARVAMPGNVGLGAALNDRQSLESAKGFPAAGPADGLIASAGGKFGGTLDEQSADRWVKNSITAGPQSIGWKYTAVHSTAQWQYWITKNGWNPEAPITRADLELLTVVEHDGSLSGTNPVHTVDVPADHQGYHVILAIWDVADTSNAFYNVIDVDIQGSAAPDTVAPSTPGAVRTTDVTSTQASLSWAASTDDVGVTAYRVLRDGVKVGSTTTTEIVDTGLTAGTSYRYTVQAVDAAGNVSAESAPVSVQTLAAPVVEETAPPVDETAPTVDTTAPTAPGGLHTMSTSESGVHIMWSASTDDSGVTGYTVLRGTGTHGALETVAQATSTSFMDSGLQAGSTYRYQVVASDAAGNRTPSTVLTTKTTAAETSTVAGAWNPKGTYTTGDVVTHGGKQYRAVQSHTGNGDPSWINAPSLWSQVAAQPAAGAHVPAPWNRTGTYTTGDVVLHSGKQYRAVQSHTGNGDPGWINAPSLWSRVL